MTSGEVFKHDGLKCYGDLSKLNTLNDWAPSKEGRLDWFRFLDLEEEIHNEGRSRIYKFVEPGSTYIIKALAKRLEENDDERRYELRFRNEIDTLISTLDHPNILDIWGYGGYDGMISYMSPFIVGEDLNHVLNKGCLDIDKGLGIVERIGNAFSHIHEKDIIIRDISAGNIVIRKRDYLPIVIDPGMVIFKDRPDNMAPGITVGTPRYMSPENSEGRRLDKRSDIYSFGAVMYHVLVGPVPFEGKNAYDIMIKHIEEPLVRPEKVRSEIPKDLGEIICRTMEKDPDNRYQTMNELLVDLRSFIKDRELYVGEDL